MDSRVRIDTSWLAMGSGPAGQLVTDGVSTGTEVSADVGYQNSLAWRDWEWPVISRARDRIWPFLAVGRAASGRVAAR
jgi:hypothetical protein